MTEVTLATGGIFPSPSPMSEQTPNDQKAEAEIDAMTDWWKGLQVENSALSARCTALEQENSQLRQRLSEVEAERDAWKATANRFRAENGELRGYLGEIDGTRRELTKDYERMKAERDALQLRLDNWDYTDAPKLRAENSTLTARCEALALDLDHARTEIRLWERRHAKDEADLTQIREALEAEKSRFDRDLQHYSSGYTQALDDALKGKP